LLNLSKIRFLLKLTFIQNIYSKKTKYAYYELGFKNFWRFSMYPYNYESQWFYPMKYWNFPNSYWYNYYYYYTPPFHEFEEEKEEGKHYRDIDGINHSEQHMRSEVAGSPGTVEQYGKGHAGYFPPITATQTSTPAQSTMPAQQSMPVKTQSVNILELLKQIEIEAPDILSTLTGLGMTMLTARELIIKILEAAHKPKK
jgi:hypothetical protein